MVASVHNLRRLRPVPDPIPWYLRVGYNDHKFIEDKLSTGDTRISRAVFDAAYLERHRPLLKALQHRAAELVLDPRTAELAMPSGQRKTLQALPWAANAVAPDAGQYSAVNQDAVADSIANLAIDRGFTAVLAPTHYLAKTSDPWINVDARLTQALRESLDRLGGQHIQIYYPLMIPYAWLSSVETMRALAGLLSSLPLDAVWLRVSNFKNDKSAAAVRHYIEGARALLSVDRPLIADHVGGLSALAIVAFGAAGGIAHGIAAHEGFSVSNWQGRRSGPFGVRTRAYAADADLYLDAQSYGEVLSNPTIRSRMGCKNKQCCPRGLDDMLGNAKGHTVNARFDQLADLAQSSASQRAGTFIRRTLMPIGANLIKLDHALNKHPELQRRIQKKRRFVDNLRLTLESLTTETRDEAQRSRNPRRAAFLPIPGANPNPPRPSA